MSPLINTAGSAPTKDPTCTAPPRVNPVPSDNDIGSCRPRASSKFDINTFPPLATLKTLNINTINKAEKRVPWDNFISRSGAWSMQNRVRQPARNNTIDIK
jgi:hypothetical protein